MRLFLILGVVLAAGASACADDSNSGDDETSYNCAAETRDDDFVLGLSKTGESSHYEFKLMSADPAPPARGDNTWVLQLNTMIAPVTPVSGASMTVTPFMPDHAHGSGKTVIVTPMTEAGQYKLSPVNLWMPGLWEITIQTSSAESDRVVFRFCLPS
jgi:YtkA-like protein